jgi:hypothetical protein
MQVNSQVANVNYANHSAAYGEKTESTLDSFRQLKEEFVDVYESAQEDAESEKAQAGNHLSKSQDYDEKAFEYVASNAPEEVKAAWMEAAKETGANGLGMAQNGMLTHISAMLVKQAENWMNGIENDTDVLGDSVTSALQSAKQALYDLDNPLEPVSKRSIAVQ